jgi:hypothetical protein
MDITFSAANTYFGKAENMTLREIVQALRETYCGSIGAEFMHCTDPAEKRWWQERLEHPQQAQLQRRREKHILDRLTAPKAWSVTCTPSTSARSASAWKAARASSPAWTKWCSAPAPTACRKSSSAWPTAAA